MIIFHNYSGAFESAKENRLVYIGKPPELPPVIDIAGEEVKEEDGSDATQRAEAIEAGAVKKGNEQVDQQIRPVESSAIVTDAGPKLEDRGEKKERLIKDPSERENLFDEYAKDNEASRRGGHINTKEEKNAE